MDINLLNLNNYNNSKAPQKQSKPPTNYIQKSQLIKSTVFIYHYPRCCVHAVWTFSVCCLSSKTKETKFKCKLIFFSLSPVLQLRQEGTSHHSSRICLRQPNWTIETVCSRLLQCVSSLCVRPSDSLWVRKMAGWLHCAHSRQGATWFRAEVIPCSLRQTPHRLTQRSGPQAIDRAAQNVCVQVQI